MVIDSSALISLLLGEPETPRFVAILAAASTRLMSAPSYVEAAIVMVSRSGPEAQEKLDRLLSDLNVQIVPFTRDQGSGHAAALNFGDCFTYALAKLSGEPVLFKGGD